MEDILLNLSAYADAIVQYLAFEPERLLQPDMLVRIFLQFLLLAASAFFSSSETALFSLSKLDLHELRRSRHPRADDLHALLDQPRRLIISILCGNQIINIAAAANMTAILVHLYAEEQVVLLNLLVMVPLLLLFGEVTPKTIAVTAPLELSTRFIAAPMNLWVRLVAPLRWLVVLLSDRITTVLVGPGKAPENILQVDEFRTLVEEVVERGELRATERMLIDNLLAAGSTEVVEIMIPRTRVDFVEANQDMSQIVERVRQIRRQRIPVYRGHRDTLVGMLHAEDLVKMALENVDFNEVRLQDLLHTVIMVPPTKKVDEMFEFFLQHKERAAVVLNEFGGIDGLVTLKSLVNFIFGHTTGAGSLGSMFSEPEPGIFEVDGSMKLADFNTITNLGLSDNRMTTISGVMLRHLDRLPEIGDEVNLEGVRLQVVSLEGHRIARLRVMKISPAVSEAVTSESVTVHDHTDNRLEREKSK